MNNERRGGINECLLRLSKLEMEMTFIRDELNSIKEHETSFYEGLSNGAKTGVRGRRSKHALRNVGIVVSALEIVLEFPHLLMEAKK